MTLDELRKEIDDIDLQIRELFIKRMAVAAKVAKFKAENGDQILKPERETQIIESLADGVPDDMGLEYRSFLKKLMGVSRTYQYGKTLAWGTPFQIEYETTPVIPQAVCYGGLVGSYSEITCKAMFPQARADGVQTFEEVFQNVRQGQPQMGVVPLENSTAGSVNEVYDLLLKYDLYINYSKVTKVTHCLAAADNADLDSIKTVYSHPQAIAQSREYIKKHHFTTLECSNTAIAARDIAQKNSPELAAICSVAAAEQFGLKILEESINHNKQNATKFVAVSQRLICEKEHNKVCLVFSCPHKSGSLAGVLGIFADYNVNLTEIHSRPDGKTSWEYLFYVDFTGNLLDEDIRALLYQLTEELPFVKILGSYASDQ